MKEVFELVLKLVSDVNLSLMKYVSHNEKDKNQPIFHEDVRSILVDICLSISGIESLLKSINETTVASHHLPITMIGRKLAHDQLTLLYLSSFWNCNHHFQHQFSREVKLLRIEAIWSLFKKFGIFHEMDGTKNAHSLKELRPVLTKNENVLLNEMKDIAKKNGKSYSDDEELFKNVYARNFRKVEDLSTKLNSQGLAIIRDYNNKNTKTFIPEFKRYYITLDQINHKYHGFQDVLFTAYNAYQIYSSDFHFRGRWANANARIVDYLTLFKLILNSHEMVSIDQFVFQLETDYERIEKFQDIKNDYIKRWDRINYKIGKEGVIWDNSNK